MKYSLVNNHISKAILHVGSAFDILLRFPLKTYTMALIFMCVWFFLLLLARHENIGASIIFN